MGRFFTDAHSSSESSTSSVLTSVLATSLSPSSAGSVSSQANSLIRAFGRFAKRAKMVATDPAGNKPMGHGDSSSSSSGSVATSATTKTSSTLTKLTSIFRGFGSSRKIKRSNKVLSPRAASSGLSSGSNYLSCAGMSRESSAHISSSCRTSTDDDTLVGTLYPPSPPEVCQPLRLYSRRPPARRASRSMPNGSTALLQQQLHPHQDVVAGSPSGEECMCYIHVAPTEVDDSSKALQLCADGYSQAPLSPVKAAPVTNLLYLSSVCPIDPTDGNWSLGAFNIVRCLHSGNACRVYHARCALSGCDVALKVYDVDDMCELNRYQVEREVQLHAGIKHPRIIQLYAAFKEGNKVVLIQEYASGGNLLTLLRRYTGRLTERQAVLTVLQPLLEGLTFLHQNGIMHRDIKPENILFTSSMELKIIDFGLAINLNQERAVTRAGTLDYMAPEVLACPLKRYPADNKHREHLSYGMAVDGWATGVLCYELLVGFPPFAAELPEQCKANIAAAELAFPKRMTPQARGFITAALEKCPADRPTMLEMLDDPWLRACKPGYSAVGRAAAAAAVDVDCNKGGEVHYNGTAVTLRRTPSPRSSAATLSVMDRAAAAATAGTNWQRAGAPMACSLTAATAAAAVAPSASWQATRAGVMAAAAAAMDYSHSPL